MSVATIDLKLETAKKQSESLYNSTPTWQEKVDNFLDRINELNGHLTRLQTTIITLNFELERDFNGFKESDKAPKILKEVTTIISKILRMVRKSDLYPGVKTTFSMLREENQYLKEVLEDRNISLELQNDPEMHEIMNAFAKAASN